VIRGLMTVHELREEWARPGLTVNARGHCSAWGRTLLAMPIEMALARAEKPTAESIAAHCKVCQSEIRREIARVGVDWVQMRWHDLQMQRAGHAPLFD
jgi:hypothetical protein